MVSQSKIHLLEGKQSKKFKTFYNLYLLLSLFLTTKTIGLLRFGKSIHIYLYIYI